MSIHIYIYIYTYDIYIYKYMYLAKLPVVYRLYYNMWYVQIWIAQATYQSEATTEPYVDTLWLGFYTGQRYTR